MQAFKRIVFALVLLTTSTASSSHKYKVITHVHGNVGSGVNGVDQNKDWANSKVLEGKVYDVGSWSPKNETHFHQQQQQQPQPQQQRQQQQQQQQGQPSNLQTSQSKLRSKHHRMKYQHQQKQEESQQSNEIDLVPAPNVHHPQQKSLHYVVDEQAQNKKHLFYKINQQQHENQILNPSQPTGCRGANLCCQGKDNTCVTLGRRMNGKNTVTCFCDSVCLPLGDCCTDYQEQCPITDCVLGQWGEWSECDVRCGYGAKQRERKVEVENKNGGKKCEPTVQKQACEGNTCKQTRSSALTMVGGGGEEMTETGRILQSVFSEWRTSKEYDPYKDIRRFIYERNGNVPLQNQQPTYCSVYKLNQVHPRCRANPLLERTISLKRGDQVCVECQYTASQAVLGSRCYGHGVYKRETRWLSLNKIGCHGTWVKETNRENCLCKEAHPDLLSFIFV